MDSENGGLSSSERQRQTAAEIARQKVLAAYSSTLETMNEQNSMAQTAPQTDYRTPYAEYAVPEAAPSEPLYTPTAYDEPREEEIPSAEAVAETNNNLKDEPVNQAAIDSEWEQYHSAWQDYYKNYYSDYYAKAAQAYLATEKMKTERIATGQTRRTHRVRHLAPLFVIGLIVGAGLFLQYNRMIFAPIMAYVSPNAGSVATTIDAIDPNVSQAVAPEPRLIIPKLNVDVPVAFNIPTSQVDAAMLRGVAQFMIPGANALPGQIGNLVISGHSAGDIYSSNQYKFIFSGLERLENGDTIYINYESKRYTYKMVKRETVEPTNVAALVYETNKPMLTLLTCTPLGTSRYRLLITAEQISPSYNDATTSAPEESEDKPATPSDSSMPANEPSFFEQVWDWLLNR